MRRLLAAPVPLLAIALVAGATPSAAGARRLAVVELFTSQGCSSCPPANAALASLADRPDVLALSFGVTYWDSLGWKDTFARPEFTARQEIYEPRLGRADPFTPQVVVDGAVDAVGSDRGAVERLIGDHRAGQGPTLTLGADHVAIGAAPAPAGGADVWLVRYDPRTLEVPVSRGENGGRTLPHRNVVRELTRLGRWTGRTIALALAPGAAGLRTAILVQQPSGGAILAAATD